MNWIIIGLIIIISLLIILINTIYGILLIIKVIVVQNDKLIEILEEIKNDIESMKVRM